MSCYIAMSLYIAYEKKTNVIKRKIGTLSITNLNFTEKKKNDLISENS